MRVLLLFVNGICELFLPVADDISSFCIDTVAIMADHVFLLLRITFASSLHLSVRRVSLTCSRWHRRIHVPSSTRCGETKSPEKRYGITDYTVAPERVP